MNTAENSIENNRSSSKKILYETKENDIYIYTVSTVFSVYCTNIFIMKRKRKKIQINVYVLLDNVLYCLFNLLKMPVSFD